MKKSDQFFFENKPKFMYGIVNINQLNEKNNISEIAFIGKSNVGKSTLINSITNTKICKSSKTPGKTKELNFFNLNNKLIIVDMPGYGFAKIDKNIKNNWVQLIYDYLFYSKNLKVVFLLVLAKKGLEKDDEDVIELLEKLNINYKIIFTKSDNCSKDELTKINNDFLISYKDKKSISLIRDFIFNLL